MLWENVEIGENSRFTKQVGKNITKAKLLLKTLAYTSPLFAKKKKKFFLYNLFSYFK